MAKKISAKSVSKVEPLDNNTIFARIPLYHTILKNQNNRDGYTTTDFLILKNKVIYRCYGMNPSPTGYNPGHDSDFYIFFSCQIFDVPDGIFDTPVIHELFEIIHFTSSNFSEIVYYQALGYKKYPPPNLESSDKTLYEFLFEENKKQKIVLSHKTCQRAYAEFTARQYKMMEEYNKLNLMRSIYHYVFLICEHTILKNDCTATIEENKLYKNQIKTLEEEIMQLKEIYTIETTTVEELTKKYYELEIKYDAKIKECQDHLENEIKIYQEKCDAYEMTNSILQQKCIELETANAKLVERTKILDESNF